jgi:hypothetical protein
MWLSIFVFVPYIYSNVYIIFIQIDYFSIYSNIYIIFIQIDYFSFVNFTLNLGNNGERYFSIVIFS